MVNSSKITEPRVPGMALGLEAAAGGATRAPRLILSFSNMLLG